MLLCTLFVSDTSSDSGFGFVRDHNATLYWEPMLVLSCILGLFASSAFLVDWVMLSYHLFKETRPLLVYRLLRMACAWSLLSKMTIHVMFFTNFAHQFDKFPLVLSIVWISFSLFFMGTEYYFVLVLNALSNRHWNKRCRTVGDRPELSKEAHDQESPDEASEDSEPVSELGLEAPIGSHPTQV